MNKCEQCIRVKYFPKEICTHCGSKEFEITLDGACLIGECQKCGFSYVVSSFFAPCEMDQTEYKVQILDDIHSNRLIVEVGKVMKINVLALKRAIERRQTIDKTYRLNEVMEIQAVLMHNDVPFHIDPAPEYEEFYRCKKKKELL